jgi:uncharacterized protein YraI
MECKNKVAEFVQLAICAAALVALSPDFAVAAPAHVATKVNLRLGPGTTYGVAATIPAGSVVDVENCAAEWCTVRWRGRIGYAIARNLDISGGPAPVGGPYPAAVSGPPVVVVGPGYYGPGYYGPGYGPGYYGPGWGPGYWGPRWGWRRW